jgi:PhoPQ-activated pathogenicity-related protein
LKWTTPEPGRLEVTTKEKPVQVNLWQAVNPSARDFREETIGKVWQCTPLKQSGPAENQFRYEVTLPLPSQGWCAFYIECIFADPAQEWISLTTEISVIPETLPHDKENK